MKLKDYLTQNDISHARFAEIVGCSQSHISLICSRKRYPSRLVALKIEQATEGDVTAMELLYPDRN